MRAECLRPSRRVFQRRIVDFVQPCRTTFACCTPAPPAKVCFTTSLLSLRVAISPIRVGSARRAPGAFRVSQARSESIRVDTGRSESIRPDPSLSVPIRVSIDPARVCSTRGYFCDEHPRPHLSEPIWPHRFTTTRGSEATEPTLGAGDRAGAGGALPFPRGASVRHGFNSRGRPRVVRAIARAWPDCLQKCRRQWRGSSLRGVTRAWGACH